jgi:YafQ family addiction module toxin component
MVFKAYFSENVKKILSEISIKDSELSVIIKKKIDQILNCDPELINHYKNLRSDLSNYKRVHVNKSFVILFSVDIVNNSIYFVKFDYHDNIYK